MSLCLPTVCCYSPGHDPLVFPKIAFVFDQPYDFRSLVLKVLNLNQIISSLPLAYGNGLH